MHLHLFQTDIQSLQPAANRARVSALAREAGIVPGSLLVLPELFSTGTLPEDFDRAQATEIAREDREFLAMLARETHSWIVAGILGDTAERDGAGPALRNLGVVIDPHGETTARYQKIHPFSMGGEDRIFAGGDQVVITAVGEFTAHIAVCYDLRFPELFRVGTRGGADPLVDLIVVPANWPASRREHWDVLLRARAIENQCYVAGVNCVGAQHGTSYEGGSALVSPKGEVLAAADTNGTRGGECVVTAEISAGHVRAWRRVFPALRDRKPDGFWSANPL